MMEAAEQTITQAVAVAVHRLPILDDPEIREALAKLRTVLEVIAADYGPVVERARSLPEIAALIPITTEAEHDYARQWLASEVAGVETDAKRIVDPFANFAHRVHRALTGLRGLSTDLAEEARGIMRPKVIAWNEHVERERRRIEAENRRRQEEAEHLADTHRVIYLLGITIAQVAELERERESMLAAAKAAEKRGDKEQAAALRDGVAEIAPTIQAAPAPSLPPVAAAITAPAAPKGIAKNWKSKLADERALRAHVAKNPQYENLFPFDQSAGDKLAKAMERKELLPGLEGWNDPTVRTTRR